MRLSTIDEGYQLVQFPKGYAKTSVQWQNPADQAYSGPLGCMSISDGHDHKATGQETGRGIVNGD